MRDLTHYLPMPEETGNVRCLNGSAHVRTTSSIEFVTCPKCKDTNTNKKYWDIKINHIK
jgi:Zn finger protein HypA/HybF involved in hydrogenase expression